MGRPGASRKSAQYLCKGSLARGRQQGGTELQVSRSGAFTEMRDEGLYSHFPSSLNPCHGRASLDERASQT